MPINEGELLTACENFFESWFGPAIGAPEAMERIEARRKKSKQEFSELLFRFVKAWQPEQEPTALREIEAMPAITEAEAIKRCTITLHERFQAGANFGTDDIARAAITALKPFMRIKK